MLDERESYTENLIKSYSSYYDVSDDISAESLSDNDETEPLSKIFRAECDFNMRSEKYILTKEAKLWAVNSFEYVFIFNTPYLTKSIFEECLSYSFDTGMSRIEPGPEHMCSYITMIIICDSADDEAIKMLRRCHKHKDFRLSLYGWMDMHTAAVIMDSGSIITNSAGRDNAKNLKTIYSSQKGRKFDHECSSITCN